MRPSVLVTGGASGIGLAIVVRLRREGYDCVVVDRQPMPDPGLAECILADLGDLDESRRVFERIARGRTITRLVNNVGTVRLAQVGDVAIADLQASVDLNVGCSILAVQAALPAMKAAGFGRIVNISSRAALGKPGRSVYAASKAAIHGLTRTLALELAASGITVTAIAPVPIPTPLFTETNPPDHPLTRQIVQAIPVGRLGRPEDIAGAVNYFLADDSGFVTGQVLYVCGGMTVGLAA
ncbi:SDR family oxidoreductase [soil metagenome]